MRVGERGRGDVDCVEKSDGGAKNRVLVQVRLHDDDVSKSDALLCPLGHPTFNFNRYPRCLARSIGRTIVLICM